jgi:hypothetical protein
VGLPAAASVLTSYLEFVPLYSWAKYGTWFLLPTEVILPTGEKTGTGGWAFANATPRAAAPLVWAGGTGRVFIGAQGALGITTKARITVKNLYSARKVVFIPCENVAEIITPLHRILRISSQSIGEECFIADKMTLLQMTSGSWPENGKGGKRIPSWAVVLILSGEEDQVSYQMEDLMEIAQKEGLAVQQDLPGITKAGDKILEEMIMPQGFYQSPKWAYNPIQFYISGKLIAVINSALEGLFQEHDLPANAIGRLLLPVEKGRVWYCEYGLRRDKNDTDDTAKVKEVWFTAVKRLLTIGAYFDRPYGPLAEIVYSRAGHYHSVVKKFKDLYDPNGIMNIGRI